MELAFIFFVNQRSFLEFLQVDLGFSKREHLEIIVTGFITDWMLFLLPS